MNALKSIIAAAASVSVTFSSVSAGATRAIHVPLRHHQEKHTEGAFNWMTELIRQIEFVFDLFDIDWRASSQAPPLGYWSTGRLAHW